ncbi:SufD family Fe-S cluster assembly protein [Arcobacter sp. YIC-80]|uniref:SufD family Fe-S cluster assembly protein n=1 Tax=Arcobacter sp. YIC-80 TaxID=3376683 RepID=UPI00384D685F
MRISDLENINLPSKYDEEFRKVDLQALFSYDFKNIKSYELDIVGLELKEDTNNYENPLFEITKNFEKKQIVLTINSNIPEPICLVHKIKEDETFYTNSIKIEVKKGAKASLIEVFTNSSQNSAYSVNREFNIEENTDFEYAKIQDINEQNSFLFNAIFKQEENSKCKVSNFELGTGLIVNSYENSIDNKNIEYNLNGLVKSKDSSNTANLIKTIHNNESSTSDINYKHSLKDKAKAVFKAKSIVNKEALYSKAFQNSNTILLSNDATIFAQPHLEILIDELEASHGATTGTLDKEQLLYLQSRGIKKEKAYDMLLNAFEGQIYDNISDELIKEFIDSYERTKYV